MRTMVRERLTFEDYRSGQSVPVTVSVAVVSARPLDGHPVEAGRLTRELEGALDRARAAGPNEIRQVEVHGA
jgi:hypothetical protein